METNHLKDVSVANPVRDDEVMYYDCNVHETKADEPTSARPFQPYQDAVINKPEGQFMVKQFLLTMKVKGWRLNKEIFMITGDHDNEEREVAMDQFNNCSVAKVFFGSIKACGEGISLVGASRVIILDVHLNPSVTHQAIGRAFRLGHVRKVYTYRLVAAGSPVI